MLFTWSTENLCIVFSSWRITSTLSLIVSLLAVIALTAGYEAVREGSRRYEERHAKRIEGLTRKYSSFPVLSPTNPFEFGRDEILADFRQR
jgi:solute carrier family 31 (copper transporter), member 1